MKREMELSLKSNLNSRQDKSTKTEKLMGLTPRAVILLIIFSVLAGMVHIQSRYYSVPTLNELWMPSSMGILIMTLWALFAFKAKGIAKLLRLDLKPCELMVIYVSSGFVYLMSGFQFVWFVINSISWMPFFYFRRPSDWEFTETLSRALFPWDKEVIDGMFRIRGIAPAFDWSVWVGPLLLWALFYAAVFFLLCAIGSVFYSRWNDAERLSFPLVTPVTTLVKSIQGTEKANYSWRNPLIIVGLLLPLFFEGTSLLHELFPVVPRFALKLDLGKLFDTGGIVGTALTTWPSVTLSIDFLALGIGYFTSLDFCFSVWFFYYIFFKLITFSSLSVLGIEPTWHFGTLVFSGGFLVYGIFLIWLARDSLARVVKVAFGRLSDDPQVDPIHGKLVFFGTIVSLLIILIFGMVLLSVDLPIMLFYILTLVTLAISHARFRTEVGLPFCQMPPDSRNTLGSLFGERAMSQASWTGIIYVDFWSVWSVPSTSAWLMEGFKMADETGMKRRSMAKVFGIVIVLLLFVVMPLTSYIFHSLGIRIGARMSQLDSLGIIGENWPPTPLGSGIFFWILGMIVTTTLAILRTKYVWWPFHPVGFMLAHQLDFGVRFPGNFFIVWLVKVLVFRWFGRGAYERFKPFFIALILSDIAMEIVRVVTLNIIGVLAAL